MKKRLFAVLTLGLATLAPVMTAPAAGADEILCFLNACCNNRMCVIADIDDRGQKMV